MRKESDCWFYDNLSEFYGEGYVEVERVYCFSFDKFTESDWTILDRIYKSLPNWLNYQNEGIPFWFGSNEENIPFLWASVEIAGLQVYGIISQNDWANWDSKFRESIKNLPRQIIN